MNNLVCQGGLSHCYLAVHCFVGQAAVSTSNALNLAGINGTIISILIAVTSGYLFVHFQALDGLKTELIDKANEVNRNSYNWLSRAGLGDLSHIDHLGVFEALARGGFGALHGVIADETDEAERAKLLPELMSRIARSYPFPTAEDNALHAVPLVLDSEKKVRAWLPDYAKVVQPLAQSVFFSPRNKLPDLVARREKDEAAEGIPDPRRAGRQGYAEFEQFVDKAFDTLIAVRLEADRVDRYRDRLPSGRYLVAAGVGTLAVFLSGVALPMVWSGTPAVIDAWIPATSYALALAGGIIFLWKLRTG